MGFDIRNATSLGYMFSNCSCLTNIDLGSFNTSKVSSASGMFNNCNSLMTIKTPINLKVSVSLPGRFVRVDNTSDGYTYLPTIKPDNATNKKIIWTSDKPAIASVDNVGKVTGVSEGTAVITAKTADGGFEATCEVTVQNVKHNFSNPKFSWSKDGKKCTLTLTCDGKNCNGKAHTENFKCTVTSKVKTKATCSSKGTTSYTATYTDENGKKYTDTKDVKDIPKNKNAHTIKTTITPVTARARLLTRSITLLSMLKTQMSEQQLLK